MTDESESPREDLPEGDRDAPSNAADAPENARRGGKAGSKGADTDVHGEPENPSGG